MATMSSNLSNSSTDTEPDPVAAKEGAKGGEDSTEKNESKLNDDGKAKTDTEIEGMDASINLIPVTGNTGLFVNPKTKPLQFDNYAFK